MSTTKDELSKAEAELQRQMVDVLAAQADARTRLDAAEKMVTEARARLSTVQVLTARIEKAEAEAAEQAEE